MTTVVAGDRMKIAVVGSRTWTDAGAVRRVLNEYLSCRPSLVSGGADGADRMAQDYAKRNGLTITIYYPDWQKRGLVAGRYRNKVIVDSADLVIAFWDGHSEGTHHTITYAKSFGVPVRIIYMDGTEE